MPFKSKAQQRYMFSQEPEVAKRWATEMPKGSYSKLPERKKKKSTVGTMLEALKKMGE
jgi:hypothetical protein